MRNFYQSHRCLKWRAYCIFIIFIFVSISPLGAQTTRLTPPEIKPPVFGKVYVPDTTRQQPGVLLLHGSAGLSANYYQYADTLSREGFVVLLVDLYAETGSIPAGAPRRFEFWAIWQEIVKNSIRYLKDIPWILPHGLGIVGFSRGAWLALTTVSSFPEVKAIVDYYGVGKQSLAPFLNNMPPLLILHGENDSFAKPAFVESIYNQLKAHNRSVELHIYPEVGHGFNFLQPDNVHYQQATSDAYQRVVSFLKKYLH